MKKTLLSIVALVALGTSVYAFNGNANCQGNMQPGMMMQGAPMGGQMMHGGMMGFSMLQQLNLSEDQRYQLGILHGEMKLEMAKLRDPKMMTKMQDMMSGDTFNKKEFIKLHNEMHEKMLTLQANHMEKVFNILTKEQRAELKKIVAQRPQRPMQMPMQAAPAPESK